MRIAWQLIAVSVMVCLCSQCSMTPDQQYVREKIPIEIQSGKPITVKIHSLSGNGWNEVGIRCSSDVWQALRDGKNSIEVRLTSSSRNGTEVGDVSPGGYNFDPRGYKLWPVDSFYYLFRIAGEYRARASVEITFKSAPEGVTHAEVIVLKTPSDTGL